MPLTSKRSAAEAPVVRHLERGRFLRVMITERPQPRLSINVPLVPAELRPYLLIADIPVRSAERLTRAGSISPSG